MKQRSVLFILPYPLYKAPSQRFRVEAYFSVLEVAGIRYKTQTFFTGEDWKILYSPGFAIKKFLALVAGFFRRAGYVIFKASSFEYIFIHREASPVGPPVFEWWLSKILRKKIIYDFDDAIWMQNTVTPNPVVDWIRAFWKISYICKWSYKIAGGNDYLCAYARQFNKNVVLLPTSVNTTDRYNFLKRHSNNKKLVIGWTGSHTTMKYLEMIYPVIEKLAANYAFDFLVISNKKPSYPLQSLKYIGWSETTEIEDLATIDIGIMPMFQDKFSEGKCGFKIIQYLSLGIPALASPVGVNSEIIDHGANGFVCGSEEEWYNFLEELLTDEQKRSCFGINGRKKIEEEYSIKANTEKFLNLFN
jgi:glycosyltransferase involved in cell wall biosynthesis